MDDALTDFQERLLKEIKGCEGEEHAIRRSSLVICFSVDERTIRLAVAAMRKRGIPVLSTSRGGGYYWPKDVQDVHNFIAREIESRTRKLHQQQAALRRNLHIHFGQMDAGLK